MTAVVLELGREPRPLPVPVALGLQEGLRILRHPIAVVGALLTVVLVLAVGDNGPRDAFEVPVLGPTFYYGVFVYFAANLVASRDRRAHSGELLAATAVPASGRVAALCVGALVPAAACAVFVAAVHLMQSARELYLVSPSVWHLTQAPLTVLGGALLGIMVGRLSRVPGTALLVMVAMVALDVWLNTLSPTAELLGTHRTWAVWVPGAAWAGIHPGSALWHDVYLACLCAMAACGAFLRDTDRRWRVLGIGAALTALAVVPALAQLP